MFVAVAVEIRNAVTRPSCPNSFAEPSKWSRISAPLFKGVGHMRDQGACLGADLASLNTKAAINAMRPIAM